MENCIFCKIIKGEIPCTKVYENEDVFCFLDIKPINIGHTLVIPKSHHATIFDIPEKDLKETVAVVRSIALAINKSLKPDGLNIGQNNGRASGQIVDHFHFHIIPRYITDGLKAWERTSPAPHNPTEIAEKIKSSI